MPRLEVVLVLCAVVLTACYYPVETVPLPDGGVDVICGNGGTYGIAEERSRTSVAERKGGPPVFSEACTHIRGNLRLWGEHDFTPYRNVQVIEGTLDLAEYPSKQLDLSAFSNLKSVSKLQISNTLGMLTSLDGLKLEGIDGGGLSIVQAKGLVSLTALKATNIRGGALVIQSADLETLDGLQGVTHLSSLEIDNNTALKTLAGLENLKRVDGDVAFRGNRKLIGIDEFLRRVEVGGRVIRE